jgi:hypothetical protein
MNNDAQNPAEYKMHPKMRSRLNSYKRRKAARRWLGSLVRLCIWDSMLGAYLALVLIMWPALVAAVKFFEGSTWTEAQKHALYRWNEIRLTWRYSKRFEPNNQTGEQP